MAQQTTVRFIDDLDGSEAVGTVTFSLDNRAYEIDLSDENTDKLHEALAPFIEHGSQGRRTFGRAGRTRGQAAMTDTPARSNREETHAIREWARAARSQGERPRAHLEVGHRGVQGRQLSKLSPGGAVVGPRARHCPPFAMSRCRFACHAAIMREDYVRFPGGCRCERLLEHQGHA